MLQELISVCTFDMFMDYNYFMIVFLSDINEGGFDYENRTNHAYYI